MTFARRSCLRPMQWLGLAGAVLIVGQAVSASASSMFPWDDGNGSFATGAPRYAKPTLVPRHPVVRRRRRADPDEPEKTGKESTPLPAQGVLQAVISIRDQRLTLYEGGTPVARSIVATGVPDHPTPTGIFSVIQKERYHTSNIYSGAPMPFMQRLTQSGIAMHLGVVPGHPASHGCIRLPDAFARQLWVTTKLGARVIIVRDEIAPAPFEHERLFALRQSVPPSPEPAQPDTPAPEGALAPAPARGESSENLLARNSEREKSSSVQFAAAELPTRVHGPVLSKPGELKPSPISVFISREEGKLFVRKGFEPVFDVPVTIERPEQPLGTHLYSSMAFKEDGAHLRWNVVSMPTSPVVERRAAPSRSPRKGRDREAPADEVGKPASSAAEALDRVTIPEDAVQRISELMSPGASLIISDYGLGDETDEYTDFIVVTH
ncbi:MAG: L,D-transpeptidase [Xanthobacteraceae bacterium]